AGGGSLREEGRAREGRRVVREALHGERLLRHRLLPDRGLPGPEERAARGTELREGQGPQARAPGVREGRLLQGGRRRLRGPRTVSPGRRVVHEGGRPGQRGYRLRAGG